MRSGGRETERYPLTNSGILQDLDGCIEGMLDMSRERMSPHRSRPSRLLHGDHGRALCVSLSDVTDRFDAFLEGVGLVDDRGELACCGEFFQRG